MVLCSAMYVEASYSIFSSRGRAARLARFSSHATRPICPGSPRSSRSTSFGLIHRLDGDECQPHSWAVETGLLFVTIFPFPLPPSSTSSTFPLAPFTSHLRQTIHVDSRALAVLFRRQRLEQFDGVRQVVLNGLPGRFEVDPANFGQRTLRVWFSLPQRLQRDESLVVVGHAASL